jgi:hypothetical protein
VKDKRSREREGKEEPYLHGEPLLHDHYLDLPDLRSFFDQKIIKLRIHHRPEFRIGGVDRARGAGGGSDSIGFVEGPDGAGDGDEGLRGVRARGERVMRVEGRRKGGGREEKEEKERKGGRVKGWKGGREEGWKGGRVEGRKGIVKIPGRIQ